jgi:predicted transcriptional regulator
MTVAKEEFGQDHWSTFTYIGTCVVGREGQVELDKMRTDPKLHPGLTGPLQARMAAFDSAKDHPTRLFGGKKLSDHDDWSCAEDLVAAGLLRWDGTGRSSVFELTDEGWRIFRLVSAFRRVGVPGRSFADFRPYPQEP